MNSHQQKSDTIASKRNHDPRDGFMATETYLALLRGINVGGKNKLSMKDLTGMFVAAGCADVRTYIQSGNVLFKAPHTRAVQLPDRIAAAIAKQFGYRTPVALRTTTELADVVAGNPFMKPGADEDVLHVMFLTSTPTPDLISTLEPSRSPPDAFVVKGREIYLQLPNGVARSKLTNAYFDSKLKTASTGRNWRTVIKLLELMNG
jgi:uncharacterized protein (DUF1697 family)